MSQRRDTERVAVRTYIPAYQKEEWQRHADELDMSQAEYVRMMVQAGRRDFDLGAAGSNTVEPVSSDVPPGGNDLKNRVLDLIREEGQLDWDELVAGLTDDIEDRLDDTLAELQQENQVQYSGRRGGYTVIDDGR